MNARPLVSAIVPVFNGGIWLAEALDSILAQTFTDFEAIIIDDGSTDGSRELALDKARAAAGRMRVISIANSGLVVARNTALAAARGAYLALLDADDAWYPDHLQRAVAAFEKDPDLGLVHANIERIDHSGQALSVPVRHWHAIDDAFVAIALRHEHIACPTAVVARAAIDAVGQFDDQFNRLGCEDRDLWLRVADRFRIRYLDHVAARYRVHPTSLSANIERMHQARKLLAAKLGRTERGRELAVAMEAMIESDLGYEYLIHGRYGQAVYRQWRAIRLDPGEKILWKRLLRMLATAGLAGIPFRRGPAQTGGIR